MRHIEVAHSFIRYMAPFSAARALSLQVEHAFSSRSTVYSAAAVLTLLVGL